jgi:hypothetical protein
VIALIVAAGVPRVWKLLIGIEEALGRRRDRPTASELCVLADQIRESER